MGFGWETGLPREDLQMLFEMIDADSSGTIEAAEFIGPLSRWAGVDHDDDASAALWSTPAKTTPTLERTQ